MNTDTALFMERLTQALKQFVKEADKRLPVPMKKAA